MLGKRSSTEGTADEEWHRAHGILIREARTADEANDPFDHSISPAQNRHFENETVDITTHPGRSIIAQPSGHVRRLG